MLFVVLICAEVPSNSYVNLFSKLAIEDKFQSFDCFKPHVV